MGRDHRSQNMLTRHRMVNAAIDRRIADVFTTGQRDLTLRIVRALSSDETGFDRICRRDLHARGVGPPHEGRSIGTFHG